MIVLGFYKYVDVDRPNRLCEMLEDFCEQGDYRGIILISKEGINASVSASRDDIDALKKWLQDDSRFQDLFFKEETTGDAHPFKRMRVKVKREIVRFDYAVDVHHAAPHLSPTEFLEVYDSNGSLKPDVMLLDARNADEFELGRFKGATHLGLNSFGEFTQKVDLETMKNRRVVMYCTGGVRCEKASAYLIEQGIEDVSQLHQGIINFAADYPGQAWEGECLVFDKRMVSPMNREGTVLSNCVLCGLSCDFKRTCRNSNCGRVYVCCQECEDRMNKCCSAACSEQAKLHSA